VNGEKRVGVLTCRFRQVRGYVVRIAYSFAGLSGLFLCRSHESNRISARRSSFSRKASISFSERVSARGPSDFLNSSNRIMQWEIWHISHIKSFHYPIPLLNIWSCTKKDTSSMNSIHFFMVFSMAFQLSPGEGTKSSFCGVAGERVNIQAIFAVPLTISM
jgi:hypothetical protein